MKKQNDRMEAQNWKAMLCFPYFLSALLIIGMIAGSVGLLLSAVHGYFYQEMEEESYRIAESYAESLKSAMEATDIINGLLKEKILAASIGAASLHNGYSNAKLAVLARTMAVDLIYIYNAEGVITYSNTGQYLGWKALPGYPVYDFMVSGETSRIEHIRPDSSSGIKFKFGYYRLNDGCFVQIGVLAEKITEFRAGFESQRMLDKIVTERFVSYACFLDADNEVIASSGYQREDGQALEAQIMESLAHGQTVKTVEQNGKTYLQVAVPLGADLQRPETLVLGNGYDATAAQAKKMSVIGVSVLAGVVTLLLVLMHSSLLKSHRLGYLAYHESLTGLPNKRCFEQDYRSGGSVALLKLMNLNTLNMTFGYQYAERLVRSVAEAFSDPCSERCELYHLSTDRFILFLEERRSHGELVELGNYVVEKLRETLSAHPIGIQMGILEYADSADPEDVLKMATVAAEQVCSHDIFGYCFYNCDMAQRMQRGEQIEAELRAALSGSAASRIYLEYQPIVDARNLEIASFEALARLETEHHGTVMPAEFIPLAEQRMMMPALGDLILRQACEFLVELRRHGLERVQVAVNISGLQLLNPDFPEAVLKLVRSYGLRESSLALEITESVMLDNFDLINAHLEKLQQNGVTIELDDFGTGYSSLSRIRDLHVDAVKIDQSFVCKILKIEHPKLILSDIISMSHKVGHVVIAEGVETVEQKTYLEENGCDYLQGHMFGRSVTQETALTLLE